MTMDKSLLHIIQVLLYSVLRENFHPHRNNKLVLLNNLKFCVFVFFKSSGPVHQFNSISSLPT